MFTGIITDIGIVKSLFNKEGDLIAQIGTNYAVDNVDIGASISHNGVCLTVIEKSSDSYNVQISKETISKTNFNNLQIGDSINLERSLKIGDELGGHMVSGHVDCVIEVVSIDQIQDSYKIDFKHDKFFNKFISKKGSVTLNGVSLTVNDVCDNIFSVNIIPHTWQVTNFKNIRVADQVNLEIDMIARYVDRLLNK